MTYKINWFLETNWPHDKPIEPPLNGMEWTRVTQFPFLPRVGDMISLGEGEDALEVESVFFFTKSTGVEVHVHFKFEDEPCSSRSMLEAGWNEG